MRSISESWGWEVSEVRAGSGCESGADGGEVYLVELFSFLVEAVEDGFVFCVDGRHDVVDVVRSRWCYRGV